MSRSEMGADDLRDLFQGQPRETAPREECPSPDEIWASARGELAPAENRRVIDHTGRCPSCAEDWRLARFVGRRAREEEGGAGLGGASAGRPSRWLPAAAAVLVALLGGAGLFVWQTQESEPGSRPVLRDEPRARIEPLTPEDEPLARAHPTLRWSGPEGATYSISVTTTSSRRIAREEGLRQAEYTLPASKVAQLEPGAHLLWRVVAVLPGGDEVPSRAFRVSIE